MYEILKKTAIICPIGVTRPTLSAMMLISQPAFIGIWCLESSYYQNLNRIKLLEFSLFFFFSFIKDVRSNPSTAMHDEPVQLF